MHILPDELKHFDGPGGPGGEKGESAGTADTQAPTNDPGAGPAAE